MGAEPLHLIIGVELCLKSVLSALHAPNSHRHQDRDRAECHEQGYEEGVVGRLRVLVVFFLIIVNDFFLFGWILWLFRRIIVWLGGVLRLRLVLIGINWVDGVNNWWHHYRLGCPSLESHDLLVIVETQIEVLEEGISEHEGLLCEAGVMYHQQGE